MLLAISFLSSSKTSAMSDYLVNLVRRSIAILGPISFQLARAQADQQNPSLGNDPNVESLATFLMSSYFLTAPNPRNTSQQEHQQDSGWWYTAPAITSGVLSLAYLYYLGNNSSQDNVFVSHSVATATILALQGYRDYRWDRDRLENESETDIFSIRQPMEKPVLQYKENEIILYAAPAA